MKKEKLFLMTVISIMLIMGMVLTGCNTDEDGGGGNEGDGEYKPGGGGGGDTTTSLYMGIIGFNENINPISIELLNSSTKNTFQSFVNSMTMKNGTVLYYAVEQALDSLKNATLPNDLVNVSIVTFTDGLDQGSVGWNDAHQGSNEKYLTSIGNRIKGDKVNGLNISAYSIGIQGGDVGKDATSQAQFTANLTSIAATPASEFVKEATSMSEVEAQFDEIAKSLYKESSIESLMLNMSQQTDGAKVRFTFDLASQDVSDMDNSTIYIEGIFDFNSKSLTNVVYQGCSSSSGATVSGTLNPETRKIDYTVENFKLTPAGNVPTDKIKLWYLLPKGIWNFSKEFEYDPNTAIVVEKKSAVIILVLDCSSSLGATDFSSMKTYAVNFINTLIQGNSGGGGNGISAPGVPSGVTATALSASSISVSWSAVSGAASYKVYYGTSSSSITSLAGTAAGTSYTNSGLQPSTTYYYRVTAVNSAGESGYSSAVSATTLSSGGGSETSAPGVPSGVTAAALSASSIYIFWNAPSSGGTPAYYHIWRSSSASGTYTEIADVFNTSYTDDGLNASTTYYYKVDAANDAGRSAQSSYASAATSSGGSSGY